MRGVARIFLLGILAAAAACGGGSANVDGSDGNPSSCPAQQPNASTACTGSAVCQYGTSTCCGMTYSFMTCTCRSGTFDCVMTAECNIVCPDAGSGG
jgi:hypothetical protein